MAKELQPIFRHHQRGIALILVLAALVLITVLVLAFLTGIGSELQSSKMYANGSSVKLLAQSSVALVIGEIQAATSTVTSSSAPIDWASEPGMIRTYDTTGSPVGYYKLYSDSNMIGTGTFNHTQIANLIPDGTGGTTAWYNQPGVYVDLNQPIYLNGTNYFPILDGNSADYTTSYSSPLATLTVPAASSTISALSPTGTNGLPAVTGFWLNSNTPKNPKSPNVAPMPVKWLYVLKNGEVIVPDSNPVNSVVTFTATTGQPQPSASDPIVGRIAYWTDDESCKVNINTASEGTFWDTPRTWTMGTSGTFSPQGDVPLAEFQPAQNEFQRYPGHPATVSLSAVFNGFTADSGYPEDLYDNATTGVGIVPRTTKGGSTEGTGTATGSLTLQGNRLYSSPDEFLFQTGTLSGGAPGTGTRTLNDSLLAATTELNQSAIQQSDFFITACSNAPDVNVFNLPRVCLWPITLKGGSPVETPFDKLIVFCQTFNNNIYYFQRQDPTSPTTDLPATGATTGLGRNRQLLEYLRYFMGQPIPGFGPGTFASKYPSGDSNQILTEMFDYIRCTNLLDTETFTGTSTATPYAPSLDPTSSDLTYRGGTAQVVPILDTGTATATDTLTGATTQTRGFGRFPTIHQAFFQFIGAGDVYTGTATTGTAPNPMALADDPATSFTPPVVAGQQRVQAGFFIEMFDPSHGFPMEWPWYQVKVTGLDGLTWSTGTSLPTNMGFPPGTLKISQPAGYTSSGTAMSTSNFAYYGGLSDYRLLTTGAGLYPCLSGITGTTATSTFPNAGPDMTSGGTFNFSGGKIVVEIDALSASGGTVTPVQTCTLSFPSNTTFPVPGEIDQPNLAWTSTVTTGVTQAYLNACNFLGYYDTSPLVSTGSLSIHSRLNFVNTISWITDKDVVRALVATPGDMRMIAPRTAVPATPTGTANVPLYAPLSSTTYPAYIAYTGTGLFSHMLRFANQAPAYGAAAGQLVTDDAPTGTLYPDNFPSYAPTFGQFIYSTGTSNMNDDYNRDYPNPSSALSITWSDDVDVPSQGVNVTMPSGVLADWDNGNANQRDGSYINKADEGDAGNAAGTTLPYFDMYYYPDPTPPSVTTFSPNRMMPSAGMFGSLPTGVWENKPWQTLEFRPGPANHPGLGTPSSGSVGPPYTLPPDHALLDLFNMPVVEPYAISTPLATSGRINMNYLIIPFTYINRDTGLRAAMKAQDVTAIPISNINIYKDHQNAAGLPIGNAPNKLNTRWPINLDSTLSQFLARFYGTPSTTQGYDGTPDIFHSASEICDIDLVPTGTTTTGTMTSPPTFPITRTGMDSFWNNNRLTGDNTRERPYANLYPLLTTKSNTFTVHFRVQTLKQALTSSSASTAWAQWREGTDQVTAEYRGSQTIERYIDPNAIAGTTGLSSSTGTTMPDYVTSVQSGYANYPPLSDFYKFRVVSTKQFPP